jgi:hypothetical protein
MVELKKPPDKYKVIKIPLKSIIRDDRLTPKLLDAVVRSNKLIIHAYQFIRLWILKRYYDSKVIPEITKDIIQMVFKALTIESVGPKPKSENGKYYKEFEEFYKTEYKKLGYNDKLDGTHLSQIIGYTSTEMVTAIENNIKANFLNYIKRFVNISYYNIHKQIFEDCTDSNKSTLKKDLKKELHIVKQDLINNTMLSDSKYHKWIILHRHNILPMDTTTVSQGDINSDPQKYIKCMIYMNVELESLDGKLCQFFPLRKNIVPKYIPIDTKSIVEIFVDENPIEYLSNITKYEKVVWNKYFRLSNPVFKLKHYTFNNYITTDCYSVSIHFLHNDLLEKEKNKKEMMTDGRNKNREDCKNMTEEEKAKRKQQKNDDKKKEENEKRNKLKEEYNRLSTADKKAFREKKKKEKKSKHVEFPYLDELTEEQIDNLPFNSIYCDPGKRDLFTFIDDNDNVLSYSTKQRLQETKRKKYERLQQNYRDKNGISQIENELSEYNSKSCNLSKFKMFIHNKNIINAKLFNAYSKPIFRQYKWYTYINSRRSEDNLLNNIEKKFASKNDNGTYNELNIIMGDWSIGKQMRNFISTPNIRLKRLLATRFNVYDFDEYNTSKLHYKTEKECNNLYIIDKTNKSRKLHSVLTYVNMKNNRKGCINRDINGVKNIRKLAQHWIEHKCRPDNYNRKVINQTSLSDSRRMIAGPKKR